MNKTRFQSLLVYGGLSIGLILCIVLLFISLYIKGVGQETYNYKRKYILEEIVNTKDFNAIKKENPELAKKIHFCLDQFCGLIEELFDNDSNAARGLAFYSFILLAIEFCYFRSYKKHKKIEKKLTKYIKNHTGVDVDLKNLDSLDDTNHL